jgi:PKD repeat protein/subtilisin-like proprotein convertase family protein
MKKKLLSTFFCFTIFSLFINGQSFTNTTGGLINDNTSACYPVTVNGLPSIIDSTNFGLISVCLNILHDYDGNLDIYLYSPSGRQIKLVNNRGGSGRDFVNTCFREDAANSIINAVAPFPGSYVPEESINILNNGQNPNGIWQLCIHDEVPFNEGSIQNFTITFGPNPPRTPAISICTLSNGAPCKCPDGTPNCELLPDLTNSERILLLNNVELSGELRIGVATPNIGFGPLDVRGTSECFCDETAVSCATQICPDGHGPKQKIVQRVYKKQGSNISFTEKPAGFMEFHPSHGHIHVEDWTSNTLRIAGPDPNPATWPIIGKDAKVSFCLINLDNCTANPGSCKSNSGQTVLYNDVGNPGLGEASGCATVQGIFPGYLDIYYPGYDGQNIPLNNTCNGWYYIVSITDPENRMKEMDETNNIAVLPIYLSQQQDNCCKAGFYADTLDGYAPFTVQFIDTTKPGSSKWIWDFGDGTKDTTQFPKHIYTKPGLYDVTLSTNAKETNCKSSVTRKSYIRVRKGATDDNPYIVQIFPNPITNATNISFVLPNQQKVSFRLLAATGQQISILKNENAAAGKYQDSFDMSRLTSGMYIIETTIGDHTTYHKIIKQ